MALKADLHLHTREGEGWIAYGARELFDRAARDGYHVLSITNHDTVTFSDDLATYARERGVLLISGVSWPAMSSTVTKKLIDLEE